ncbi:MAG: hypothetical protein CL610_24605 [Anaerolineaceae bacterium]|nr:hypothetical protein [Anaerolineaceae bacterium]
MYTNWYASWHLAHAQGRDLRQAADRYRRAKMLRWVAVPLPQVPVPVLKKAISRRLIPRMASV